MIKVTEFLTKKAGMTRPEFFHHWRFVHAPLVCGTPEIIQHNRRYDQAHALALTRSEAPAALPYDGAVEVLCDDLEALSAIFAAPSFYEKIQPDEANFIDIARSRVMIGDAHDVWRRDASPPAAQAAKLIIAIARADGNTRREAFSAVLRAAEGMARHGSGSDQITHVAVTETLDLPPGDVEAAHFDATLELWFADANRANSYLDRTNALGEIFRKCGGRLDAAASGVMLATEVPIWPLR